MSLDLLPIILRSSVSHINIAKVAVIGVVSLSAFVHVSLSTVLSVVVLSIIGMGMVPSIIDVYMGL